MVPENFFIVRGSGISQISTVNAFDTALIDAGLDNVNIIPVSSIISPNARQIASKRFDTGSMVYTVLSKNKGTTGDKISTGLIWGWAENKVQRTGLVVTAQQNFIDNKILEIVLKQKINEMAFKRNMVMKSFNVEIESLEITANHYGCVIVVFVYSP
jgi:arginine decarboxylase